MPPAKKRKTRAATAAEKADHEVAVAPEEAPPVAPDATTTAPPVIEEATSSSTPPPATATATATATAATTTTTEKDVAAKAKERMARFRALQARAKTSSEKNLKEATHEAQRLASDPSQLPALQRKHAIASQKLMRAETEDGGGDFERKRAWDWTVDESERWDKHVDKQARHRDNNAFQDWTRESQRIYKRQVKNLGDPDLERYTADKMRAIEKAAAQGTLEIVETEDGEMIAVDKEGTFYSTADSTSFAEHKPDKAAVDRLVGELKKAEDITLKKRRERNAKNGDDDDVTYINDKNKHFNKKLERFYNKYTAEIRDSFERGTMI